MIERECREKEMKILFEDWSNSMKTISGGTRDEVKLNRPWQIDINVDSSKCPFCTGRGKIISSFEGGWLLLENLFSPYEFHRMIAPDKCWPKEQVRLLGGLKNIKKALMFASDVVKGNVDSDFCLGVHVGFYAGQNISHLHYHLLKPYNRPDFDEIRDKFLYLCRQSSYIILETENWIVVAGGIRAGQCFIVPKYLNLNFNRRYNIQSLAETIEQIVNLYNKKFLSAQGLPPDYRLTIRIKNNNEIFAGWYVPILNHWGFDHDTAFIEKQPIVLPWTHKTTVNFLNSPE